MMVMVLYDIVADPLRVAIASLCKDYALKRIQYSVFVGRLSNNRRDELALVLAEMLGSSPGRIHIIPLHGQTVSDMQVFHNPWGKHDE